VMDGWMDGWMDNAAMAEAVQLANRTGCGNTTATLSAVHYIQCCQQ